MSDERWQGESPVFTKTYDLLLWPVGRVSQFPKEHRFRLACRIEDAAFGFHERLLLATRADSPRTELRLLLTSHPTPTTIWAFAAPDPSHQANRRA